MILKCEIGYKYVKWKSDEKDLWFNSVITVSEGGEAMSIAKKRLIILLVIALVAFVLGRLAVRGVLNLLLGGTLFGGNFL